MNRGHARADVSVETGQDLAQQCRGIVKQQDSAMEDGPAVADDHAGQIDRKKPLPPRSAASPDAVPDKTGYPASNRSAEEPGLQTAGRLLAEGNGAATVTRTSRRIPQAVPDP